jgi:arsenate reductase-like glutaredoxin family protein
MVRQTYVHLSQEALSEVFNQVKINVDACFTQSNTSFSETNQVADKDRKHDERTNPSSECD